MEQIDEAIEQEEIVCVYLYTPMCGTCQLASRMLEIVQELFPDIKFCKSDINYMPERAISWSIESVPCLLIFRNAQLEKKIYAFHSVPYLYETIKKLL
ncbi:thiol-disulfide isomerase/thioredoxin [Anoxybacillus caldiproteolyticus]|uniref:Thiol-disulfide isomerase/thioredoxin n=1 Tax=Thermaerobacillus caldiproteolyticus TaxID=247480 RepID=A0A7W0BZJ1_9BACL|nr:thiol-disulfide isomerase/thioredoxin [Anoxybacillus caldiproteolyticus]